MTVFRLWIARGAVVLQFNLQIMFVYKPIYNRCDYISCHCKLKSIWGGGIVCILSFRPKGGQFLLRLFHFSSEVKLRHWMTTKTAYHEENCSSFLFISVLAFGFRKRFLLPRNVNNTFCEMGLKYLLSWYIVAPIYFSCEHGKYFIHSTKHIQCSDSRPKNIQQFHFFSCRFLASWLLGWRALLCFALHKFTMIVLAIFRPFVRLTLVCVQFGSDPNSSYSSAPVWHYSIIRVRN